MLIASAVLAVCFTPSDSPCESMIVKQIDAANRSVLVQAYSLTSKPITSALIAAKNRGAAVLVLADKSQRTERNSTVPALVAAGVPVMEDYRPAIAHNKVVVLDGQRVVTGSFNFTYSAEHRNAENALVLDDANIVAQYIQNFVRRKDASRIWNSAQ